MKYINSNLRLGLLFLMCSLVLVSFTSAEIKTMDIAQDGNFKVTTVWGIDKVFFNVMRDRVSVDRGSIPRNNCSVQKICEKIKKVEICHNKTVCTKLSDAEIESIIRQRIETKYGTIPTKKTKSSLIIKLWEIIKSK